MKHITLLTLLTLLYLLSLTAHSQDLIYLKTSSIPINAKVIEINSTEVKYKFASDSFPILYFPKADVSRVVLNNGTVIPIEKSEDLDDNKRVGAVKTGFLAPIVDHTNIMYEGYVRNHQSFEITLGIIGLGKAVKEHEHPSGWYTKFGYKWIVPGKLSPTSQPKKLLHGFYVKPELMLGYYTIKYDDRVVYTRNINTPYYYYSYTLSYEPVDSRRMAFISGILNVGYQVVLGKGFTVDLNTGLGYYWAGLNQYREEGFYAFQRLGGDIPLAFNAGFRVGYTFCKEKRFQLAE